MPTDNIASGRIECRPEFGYLRPVNFKTAGEPGEALLDSFERQNLKQGDKLCCRLGANNFASWFVYRQSGTNTAAAVVIDNVRVSFEGAGQPSSWDAKEALSLLGVIALFSLFVTSAFRTIIDGATYAPGGVDDAILAKEGVALEQAPAVLEIDGLENEQWWLALTETDRERIGMVIERDLPHALEGEEFRRLYLDEAGRVKPEGIRVLMASKGEGDNPLGRADVRVASLGLGRTEREASGRSRDVVRSLKVVK